MERGNVGGSLWSLVFSGAARAAPFCFGVRNMRCHLACGSGISVVSSTLFLICGMTESSLTLNFESLSNGQLGISSVYGSFLAEAASHCLRRNNHFNPVLLDITGDTCTVSNLTWREARELSEETWGDLQEATEYGA